MRLPNISSISIQGGSEILLTPWTSQSFWHLSALASGSYTWQVKARNSNGETSWSSARNLAITASAQSEPLSPLAVNAPFSDGMENAAPGWTALNWTLTSEANHTPDRYASWKYDVGSANGYDNSKPNAGYLTSPAINLACEWHLLLAVLLPIRDRGCRAQLGPALAADFGRWRAIRQYPPTLGRPSQLLARAP